MTTILEAKASLRANFEEGVKCPCCGQRVQEYRRKLTSSMAHGLIAAYNWHIRNPDKEWFHVSEFDLSAFRGGDFAKVKLWNLALEMPNPNDPTKRSSGMWKLSESGKMFVRNEINVPKYVYIYDNKVTRKSEEITDIMMALGDKFNYSELMEGR